MVRARAGGAARTLAPPLPPAEALPCEARHSHKPPALSIRSVTSNVLLSELMPDGYDFVQPFGGAKGDAAAARAQLQKVSAKAE